PWADAVGYAENSVGLRVGEGIWSTVTAAGPKPLIVADAQTGKAVWIGRIDEHGQPAWAAVTVQGAGGKIAGIEALIRRKEYGPPFAEPGNAPQFSPLARSQRVSREELLAAANSFYDAVDRNDGTV